MDESRSRWGIGQVVQHLKFGYRGVIADVDSGFEGTPEWYEEVARSRPPKDQPWYHVLVDGADHTTYVAERHLGPDLGAGPVRHPLLEEYFDGFRDGAYTRRRSTH